MWPTINVRRERLGRGVGGRYLDTCPLNHLHLHFAGLVCVCVCVKHLRVLLLLLYLCFILIKTVSRSVTSDSLRLYGL